MICLFCDNESVVKMLCKSTSSCKKCMILIRKITLWAIEFNIRILAKHVSTDKNGISDALSRMQMHRFRKEVRLAKHTVYSVPEEMPDELWPVHKVWNEF